MPPVVTKEVPRSKRLQGWPQERLAPTLEQCGELGQRKRFGEIVIHAGGETLLTVAFQRIGGEGDDGGVAGCSFPLHECGSRLWRSYRPSLAYGNPMRTRSNEPRSTADTASLPFSAMAVVQLRSSSMVQATSRFTGLSSASRTWPANVCA